MIRNLITFLIFGFVWLFLFSMPVGHGKRLFDVGYYYFVDTRPVHWFFEKFNIGVQESQSKASEAVDKVIDSVTDKQNVDEKKSTDDSSTQQDQ